MDKTKKVDGRVTGKVFLEVRGPSQFFFEISSSSVQEQAIGGLLCYRTAGTDPPTGEIEERHAICLKAIDGLQKDRSPQGETHREAGLELP